MGVRHGGRKKGTPNRTTLSVRQVYEEAFELLGGVKAMVEWAKENQTEFYKLHAKLMPIKTEVTGADGQPIQVITGVPIAPLNGNGH